VTTPLHGIDFSGARQAGHGIWLAETTVDGGTLRVEHCESAADRFGVAERAPCLGRLCSFLRDASVVGLDFSFGVPAALHDREDWTGMVEWVSTAAHDVDGFEELCVTAAEELSDERTYLLRETDGPVGAKSPYHWLVAAQTFYGIRDVLAACARTDEVCVRPMQEPASDDATRLCEIYPTATLASLSLPAQEYKEDDEHARDQRRTIVDGLEAATAIELADGVRNELVADAGGDALDAVVAALATYRAWQADFEPDREYHSAEGHIYV